METNSDEVAVLVGQTGPLNGQRWSLRSTLVLGRDPSCDIVIPDRQVSRHHARLTPTPGGVRLEDLSSKNGTHFNGQVVTNPRLLEDGDVIQIALAQQFVFLSSDATVPLDSDEMNVPAYTSQPAGGAPATPGRLRLEKRSRRVWIGTEEVIPPLSVSQFKLLEILYDYPDRVVSRQDIIAEVWGRKQAIEVSEQALDALVRRLRDRLAMLDPTHAYMVTIRGHGLRLDNPKE